MAFVAGVVALVWTFTRGGPLWLVAPAWLAAVLGGAGTLILGIPWLWKAMA